MRVFITYGHDFISEAKMLAESLKSAGYEVWIDCEGIIAGDDWRDSITEAILSSDLEENSITSIDTIELTFNIYDADTLLPIAKTPTIRFSTK